MAGQNINQRQLIAAHDRSFATAIKGYNASALAAHDVVAINGFTGAYSEMVKADFTNAAHMNSKLLIADMAMGAGKYLGGYVEWKIITDVNTNGSTVGNPVYGSTSTPGAWTLTKPSSNARVIGTVLEVSATVGVIILHPNTVNPFTANDINLADNTANAWELKEAANSYLKAVTTNSAERLEVGKPLIMGSGMFIGQHRARAALADADATLNATQLKNGIVSMTPTAGRAINTRTAAQIVADYPGCIVGTCFELVVVNLAAAQTITLNGGAVAGITNVGVMTVPGTGTLPEGSAKFLVLITNVGAGTEAVDLIRVS